MTATGTGPYVTAVDFLAHADGHQGMVTRTGWDGTTWGANQRMIVAEAIRVNTLHGADAAQEEASKGSIAVRKLADFVMLADDPHTVKPDAIKDIRIVQTVGGGAPTYTASVR